MSQRRVIVSFGNVTVNNYGSDHDSADLPAGDAASDTFDRVDGADSSEDASWT
jgi:hypothetical protein